MWTLLLLSLTSASLFAGLSFGFRGDAPASYPEPCRGFFELEPQPLSDDRPPSRLRIVSPSIACWDGSIEREPFAPLHEWALEASETKTLFIRSGGGDSEAALRLAQQLNGVRGRTVILDVCASACANYLYAAMKARSIHGRAAILFHGGFGPQIRLQAEDSLRSLIAENPGLFTDPEEEIARNLTRLDQLAAEQDDLLDEAGVSRAVIEDFYRVELDSLPASACTGDSRMERTFLFFSALQIERLGLGSDSGVLLSDTPAVHDWLAAMGADFSVCQAPNTAGLFIGVE